MKEVDVNFLMKHLHQHAYKWRDIGSSLNFHHGELENISQRVAKPNQYLNELLSKWSHWPTEDHSEKPTMESLCDALRSDLVGLGRESNDLYELKNFLPSQC